MNSRLRQCWGLFVFYPVAYSLEINYPILVQLIKIVLVENR